VPAERLATYPNSSNLGYGVRDLLVLRLLLPRAIRAECVPFSIGESVQFSPAAYTRLLARRPTHCLGSAALNAGTGVEPRVVQDL
jgi:hypothetical protein